MSAAQRSTDATQRIAEHMDAMLALCVQYDAYTQKALADGSAATLTHIERTLMRARTRLSEGIEALTLADAIMADAHTQAQARPAPASHTHEDRPSGRRSHRRSMPRKMRAWVKARDTREASDAADAVDAEFALVPVSDPDIAPEFA